MRVIFNTLRNRLQKYYRIKKRLQFELTSVILYSRGKERKQNIYNLLESVNIMTINISMKTKSLSINVFTSINFDDIDFDKSMIFVWLNDVIVGSIVLPNDEDIDIDFWVDDKCKSFNNYEDFRKFYNTEYKNLII